MALTCFALLLAVTVNLVTGGPILVTYAVVPSLPENIYNQVQDTAREEYAFGYAGGPVAREEAKTADGVTRGAYSYVDANGIIQHYRYVADDDGFRVVGTNIPTDVNSGDEESQRVALETVQAINGAKATATANPSNNVQNRKKRSATYSDVALATVEPIGSLAIGSVPTATSSQSRVQIHKSLKLENLEKTVAAIPAAAVAVEAIPVDVKTIQYVHEEPSIAIPVSTSSQSRFQIHKNLKIQNPAETVVAIPAALPDVQAVPIDTNTSEVISETVPVAVPALIPLSTSSQSHLEIDNSSKAKVPVEAVAATPPAPTVVNVAPSVAEPIEIVQHASPAVSAVSVPVATSSQTRFQIHKTSKIEASEPVEAVEVVPVVPALAGVSLGPKIHAVPAETPVAIAADLPTATSSQSRFQIHNSLKAEVPESQTAVLTTVEAVKTSTSPLVAVAETIEAIPEGKPATVVTQDQAATAASNQKRFQIHDSSKLHVIDPVLQTSDYTLVHVQQPVITVQAVNSDSLPLIARSSAVGVGLGVLPSPVAAYYQSVQLANA